MVVKYFSMLILIINSYICSSNLFIDSYSINLYTGENKNLTTKIEMPLVTKTNTESLDIDDLVEDIMEQARNFDSPPCDNGCFDLSSQFIPFINGIIGVGISVVDIAVKLTFNNVPFFSSLLPIANIWLSWLNLPLICKDTYCEDANKEYKLNERLQTLNFFSLSKEDLTKKIMASADKTIFKDDYDQKRCYLNKRLIIQILLIASHGVNYVVCPMEAIKALYLSNTIFFAVFLPSLVYKKIKLACNNPDEEKNKQEKYREIFKSRIEHFLASYQFYVEQV